MRLITILMVLAAANLFGCAARNGNSVKSESPSGLTHGNVQLTLQKGITTQNEVLETFGPPNIMTHDSSGQEVWTYQRHATLSESQSSGVYGTVILFGAGSGTTGFEQSSRTMTLIIKFDDEKRVSDFRSMATSF